MGPQMRAASWGLLCSSFLVVTCFLLKGWNYKILRHQELHRSLQVVATSWVKTIQSCQSASCRKHDGWQGHDKISCLTKKVRMGTDVLEIEKGRYPRAGLQVCKYYRTTYLIWVLKHINKIQFGLFGTPGVLLHEAPRKRWGSVALLGFSAWDWATWSLVFRRDPLPCPKVAKTHTYVSVDIHYTWVYIYTYVTD